MLDTARRHVGVPRRMRHRIKIWHISSRNRGVLECRERGRGRREVVDVGCGLQRQQLLILQEEGQLQRAHSLLRLCHYMDDWQFLLALEQTDLVARALAASCRPCAAVLLLSRWRDRAGLSKMSRPLTALESASISSTLNAHFHNNSKNQKAYENPLRIIPRTFQSKSYFDVADRSDSWINVLNCF
jgi:hypothetical protein